MNKDKIRILSDKEKCIEKLPVWYGSRDNYTHGLKEVVANAVDEVFNNFESGEVIVELHKDLKTITVKDTGRGMPIHIDENIEALFQTLFAGTKLDTTEKTTTGTNGCGLTVLNYTSTFLNVKSSFNKKTYCLKFENGELVSKEELSCSKDTHGTEITFLLNKEVYTNTTYNPEEVENIVEKSIVSTPNIKATFIFKDDKKEFCYKSLEEYFNTKANDNIIDIAIGTKKRYEEEGETNVVEGIICANKVPVQEAFLNMNYLVNGGSMNEGVINSVRLNINKYLKETNSYNKKEKAITNKDVENSISFIITNFSNKIEYANQTKLSTHKTIYKTVVSKYINDLLEVYKIEAPHEYEKLAKHILINKRANEKANKTIDTIKKKLQGEININNKIEGFINCKVKTDGELFICEGNSAAGSIVLSRDANNQAVLALRGKILNCLKADLDTIFENRIIVDMLKVLGCGVEIKAKHNKELGTFDKSKLKFSKIFITTDQDDDGLHIGCLILSALKRLVPTLIEDGHVYVVNTPLFEIRDLKTDKMHYAYSEEDKEKILQKVKKYVINRNKGLGEIDAETMSKSALNPKTRNITKITIGDVEKMEYYFNVMMGDLALERKQYISENLKEYI